MGIPESIYEIPGVRKLQIKLNQMVTFVPPPPPLDAEKASPKKILLVTSHPVPESFSLAIAKTVEETAIGEGHAVKRIDLGLDRRFSPVLTAGERRSYSEKRQLKHLPRDVRGYIQKLKWCDTLVLVYPTWWMSTPANLKGFFDRTLVRPHTWDLPRPDEDDQDDDSSSSALSLLLKPIRSSILPQGLEPGLTNIEQVLGISTYGASRSVLVMGGDNGRNMINTAILPLFHRDCTIRWLGLYDMDFQTEENRKAFLETVKTTAREKL